MTLRDQRDRILEFPWPLLAYDSWRRRQRASRSTGNIMNIFAAELGFSLRDDDVVQRATWELSIEDGPEGALLRSPLGEAVVNGVDAPALQALLERVDGQRTAAEIVGSPALMQDEGWPRLDALVGHAVTVPDTVQALRARVPGPVIVRFPTTPYAVLRNYWHNMGDVWARRQELPQALASGREFERWLRDLHLTAVMGERLDCFYKPGSPVADRRVQPGSFDDRETWVTGDTMRSTYFPLLAALQDDPVIFTDGWVDEVSGLRLGQLRHLKSKQRRGPAWFPERPVRAAHLALLAEQLAAARAATSRDERLTQLARFHQAFVRIHPFVCANQCVAMTLLNAVLAAGEGKVLPHLHLDYCALLLSPEAYARVFTLAVDRLARPEGGDDVYAEFEPLRQSAIAFVRKLLACRTPAAAHELLDAEPDAAALVLLSRR